jgi:hypothetical protein
MSTKLLFDTDVIIDFFRGKERAVDYVKSNLENFALSVITIAELYAGMQKHEKQEIDEFVSVVPVIQVSVQIAKTGGILKLEYGAAHGIGIADALMAATAIEENLQLVSLNIKHYPMFPHLEQPY